MKLPLLVVIMLILLAVPIFAVMTINPQKYQISDIEFNKTYNVIITAINPDTSLFDVQVMINKDSYYLLDHIKIEPTNFRINPNDKKNIKLSVTVPPDLSPEEHILFLDFLSANYELGKFKLSFEVPGTKRESLEVIKIDSDEEAEVIYFNFQLLNSGNVIIRGSPIIEILHGSTLIETFGQESQIMIMPKDEYNLSIMFDKTALSVGDYKYVAKFRYNDVESNYTDGSFSVTKKSRTATEKISVKSGENLAYELNIKNPTSELSFYKITYVLNNQEEIIEGQIQGQSKDVILDIETGKLRSGTYSLAMTIEHGRRLENSETKDIEIQVRSGMNIYWWLLPVIFLGAVIYIFRPKRSRKPSSHLGLDIQKLNIQYQAVEQSMHDLTKDIHSFVRESNHWLHTNGYGHYGFK